MTKITEYLQYYFTDSELLEMGREQSRTVSEKSGLERKKSELAKALAGEIEAKQSIIERIAEGIRNGYEWRDIECTIRLDSPRPGMAELVRLDTGEVAKTRRMTADELQLQLDLQAEQAPANEQMPLVATGPEEPDGERLAPVVLPSAVEVAGTTDELKKQRKARGPRQGEQVSDPCAETMELKRLEGPCGPISVTDRDGVLTWAAEVHVDGQRLVSLRPGDGSEPPLSVPEAIREAAKDLAAWAGTCFDALTADEQRAVIAHIQWANSMAEQQQRHGGMQVVQ